MSILTLPRNNQETVDLISKNIADNYPFDFDKSSDIYKENEILVTQTNCYVYALGSTVPLEQQRHLYGKPGTISGRLNHNLQESDKDTFLRRCIEDIEFLNLPKLVGKSALEILVYIKNCYNPIMQDNTGISGFHMVRRDSDDTYSHKPGWEDAPEEINPELSYGRHKFAGRIVVANSGVIVKSNLSDIEQ